jgi:chromosome partitioning protein
LPRTIAVANHKGGTAKTTTAVNLGAALAEGGWSVVLVDLDPQGSATQWLSGDRTGTGLYDVLRELRRLDELAQPTSIPGLEFIPASQALVRADQDLAGEIAVDLRLRSALQETRPRDFVLLDCPPNLGVLVVCALVAATDVLIPVAAHVMELQGLGDLLRPVASVRRHFNADLRTWMLACRVDRRTRLAGEVLDALGRQFPDQLLETVIHENVRLAEAPGHREPITVYAPYSSGAADYRELAVELAKRGR